MEKPGNFFVIARMWEKQSGSASLLRFHCERCHDSKWVIPNN